MVAIKKYNPCSAYIDDLTCVISCAQKSDKKAIIKYDQAKFITNLSKDDILDLYIDDAELLYSDKGLLIIKPQNSFFINHIDECPSFEFITIKNLELSGIIKRMYAQIEFEYYSDDELTQDEISICDHIFKVIYTNSVAIKQEQLKRCLEKYNGLQHRRYANKKVIDGIIYAAYDLYNSLSK